MISSLRLTLFELEAADKATVTADGKTLLRSQTRLSAADLRRDCAWRIYSRRGGMVWLASSRR